MKEVDALERKKKFLLVLPVLFVPFLILMFWLMDGGKGSKVIAAENPGLNTNLPNSGEDSNEQNSKLDAYNEAEQDSLRWLELVRSDPNYSLNHMELRDSMDNYGLNTSLNFNSGTKSHEEKIVDRLEQLNHELRRPAHSSDEYSFSAPLRSSYNSSYAAQQDLERLEQMMQRMNAPAEEDQEMTQLNNMMDKILDIQHPQRVKERSDSYVEKRNGQVFAVRPKKEKLNITLLDNKSALDYAAESSNALPKRANRFFGLEDFVADEMEENVIEAVVHEDQTVTTGSVIKFRLSRDVQINGVFIPKDEFVTGIASLQGERLEVDIESIRFGNSIFPVKLSAYDMDGLAGIYIPGTIARDVVKQNSDQALQSMSLMGFDQSLGAQAASAGIEMGKNLFSRKIRLIKVNLKAGYKVFLKDNKRKEE
ncbi:putative Bacteroides conjugative transposon TraM protein [Sphingobacterium sp. PM2-P1-29]|nr:putative Bacteroides conjugative transposon TraM protein [Sphingobacterium sp. PM2-P1-29]